MSNHQRTFGLRSIQHILKFLDLNELIFNVEEWCDVQCSPKVRSIPRRLWSFNDDDGPRSLLHPYLYWKAIFV